MKESLFIQASVNYLTEIDLDLSFESLDLQQNTDQLKIIDINSEIKEIVIVK